MEKKLRIFCKFQGIKKEVAVNGNLTLYLFIIGGIYIML